MNGKMRNSLLGAAGVAAACAQLNRRGIIAVQTSRNTKGVDVLIEGREGIQVKCSPGKPQFTVLGGTPGKMKMSDYFAEHIQYDFVFVSWPEGERPKFFVVPKAKVLELLNRTHEEYGKKHPKTTWRKTKPGIFHIPVSYLKDYEDRWDLILGRR